MTDPTSEVVLRPPLLARIYVVAFLIFWVALIVWMIVIRHHGLSIVEGGLFIVFGLALGYRLIRIGVHANSDGTLLVRNNFGGVRLTRAQIEEFRIGRGGGSRLGERSIQALLRDGTVYRLDVTRTPLGFQSGKRTRQLDQLNAWLRG